MEMVKEYIPQIVDFFKANPHILTMMVAFLVISLVVTMIKRYVKIAILLWIITIISSTYYGYNIWEEINILKSLKNTAETQNVKIEDINGDTVKAVIDGVTKLYKVTDGKIVEILNK